MFLRDRTMVPRWIGCLLLVYLALTESNWAEEDITGKLLELSGLILVGLATVGRVWCASYIGGRKDLALVTEGPFSVVRHPLYFFSLTGIIGLGLGAKAPVTAAVLGMIFLAYYHWVIKTEECVLETKFGAGFHDYRRKVPRLLPRPRLFDSGKVLHIVPAHLLKSVLDALWFLWFYVILQIFELLHLHGRLPVLWVRY